MRASFDGFSPQHDSPHLSLTELGTKYPDIKVAVDELLASSTTEEKFYEAVAAYNETHMHEKSGLYNTIDVPGTHRITVKYYANGSSSISASWSKT